jgi:hypothetical protein
METAKCRYTLITDVVKEMEWWACFDEGEQGFEEDKDEFNPFPADLEVPEPHRAHVTRMGFSQGG